MPDETGLGPGYLPQALLDDEPLIGDIVNPAKLYDTIRHTAAKLVEVAERIGSGPRDEDTLDRVERAKRLLDELQDACEAERALEAMAADPRQGEAA